MIKTHIEHCYTARETATFGGSDHIVVDEPLEAGRLVRQAGDALCKPRRKFRMLDPVLGWRLPNCKRCSEIAERLGIVIGAPAPVEDPPLEALGDELPQVEAGPADHRGLAELLGFK